MIKFFKEYLSDYDNAQFLQIIVLLSSVFFFLGLIYSILKKPKKYYKETSEIPLSDDDSLF